MTAGREGAERWHRLASIFLAEGGTVVSLDEAGLDNVARDLEAGRRRRGVAATDLHHATMRHALERKHRGAIRWLAHDRGGELVGVATAYWRGSALRPVLWLDWIGTWPGNRGCGAALMAAVAEAAAVRGAAIEFTPYMRAAGFYRTLGFRRTLPRLTRMRLPAREVASIAGLGGEAQRAL